MKIKKILSLLVALTLVCSFMTVTNVQAAEDEFAILKTLGINTDFSDDTTPITRYQLAEIAMELTKLSPEPEGEPTYPDVPVKHKYFPIINAVSSNGIMGALADGSFSPDANATAMDGGRILLSELGYTAFAVQAGWTDAQYNSKVQSLGLMSGVDASEGLTYYGIGRMMVNMLTKKVMEIVAVDAEGIKFKESDLTYVEYKYGYKIKTGVMQANGSSSASGYVAVTAKQAVIDGVIYKTDGRDYTEYVGYNVKFIVTSEYEDGRIIHIEKYKGSEELVIDADNITGYDNRTYTYLDEDGSSETASFPTSAKFLINGQNMGTYNAKYFTPDLGSVTLVDTDGDYEYDLVNISTKMYFKVGGTTASTISDTWTGVSIDVTDYDAYIYSDGKSADLMSIGSGSYAEVSTGAVAYNTVNGNEIMSADLANSDRITVSVVDTTTVTGEITTKRVDAVGIEGVMYEFNPYYYDLICSDYTDAIGLGATATLVLNEKGQVIDIVDVISAYANSDIPKNYGYMTNINPARGETGQGVVRIIDLTTLEEAGYVTAVDCKINGKKFEYNEAVALNTSSNTNFFLPDGEFKHQLIRYALNEAGEITELYLAVDRAHEKLTKHILPLSNTDFAVGTTVDYYINATNTDYDAKYKGYDPNNFTLDENGYLAARSVVDGLYSMGPETIQLKIPVNKAVDSTGAELGATDTGHYAAYATVQDTKYWEVEIGNKKEPLVQQSMSAQSDWNYLALYDASEKYVPAVAIKYTKALPVSGDAPITGTAMGEAKYNGSARYYYVTEINTVFDEATQEEKREITGVAATTSGLETQKFIPATKIKESDMLNVRKVTGYDFALDMATYGGPAADDYQITKAERTAKTWDEIRVGDMIEVRLNTAGEVGGFRIVVDGDVIADAENLKCGYVTRTSWVDEMGYIAVNLGYCLETYGVEGALVDIGGPNATLSARKMINTLNYTPGGNNSIRGAAMIIHTKSKQCEEATLADVKVGDYVLYRRNTGDVVEVFIIRP